MVVQNIIYLLLMILYVALGFWLLNSIFVMGIMIIALIVNSFVVYYYFAYAKEGGAQSQP